ncbi:MAG: TlpA disulfide reductase family protein [Bryobacteraceae bacterium]
MLAVVFLLLSANAQTALLDQVRAANTKGDFATADRALENYRQHFGVNAEYALAMSWQARAALALRQLDKAETYADRARDLSLQVLKGRKLDAEPMLPLALGASIEVHGQVMAQRGQTSSAVGFMETEKRKYAGTSIVERISKNINLLSLKGKRAPSLDATEWIGTKPAAWSSYRGKPVLVFFWAHWCPDCKQQAPVLANLMRRYGSQGLVMVTPTRYYGYVEGGEDAARPAEKRYIGQIRDRYYGPMAGFAAPLSNTIFEAYGCSSTPTFALIDKQGIVGWYHPGMASEAELVREIEAAL